jgi:transcriptional regulator
VYVPTHFAMPDDDVLALLADHGAGDLVTCDADTGLTATLLPFVHEPSGSAWGSLHGHLARNNAQWRGASGTEALVILRGPDGYVSPDWYATKREHGRVVPTWNYVTVHVHGRLVVHDDTAYVRRVVEALTDKHEASRVQPWAVDDAPASFVEGQLRAIVGVQVEITRVEAKAKLSQNRSPADVDGVVRGLRQRGDAALAAQVADRAR